MTIWDLSDVASCRLTHYNGFVSLYLGKISGEKALVWVPYRGAGIIYPEFIQLPLILSAPYYKYQYILHQSLYNSYTKDILFFYRPAIIGTKIQPDYVNKN